MNKTVPLMNTMAIKEIRVVCAVVNLIWVSLRQRLHSYNSPWQCPTDAVTVGACIRRTGFWHGRVTARIETGRPREV